MAEDSRDDFQWYLPNDADPQDPKGPYTSAQVIERIRLGKVRADGFIWGSHFQESKWKRVFEIETFYCAFRDYPRSTLPRKRSRGERVHKKVTEEAYQYEGEYGRENLYRRFPRAPLEAEVVIHNQKRYRKARVVNISEKGAFIEIDEADAFEKGEVVTLTIRGSNQLETFSVTSVIMRVVHAADVDGYGCFFLRLNPQIKRKIARYVLDTLNREEEAVA